MASHSPAARTPPLWPASIATLREFDGTLWVAFAVLSCAIVLLRVPFQLTVLDHWDSVQYALGLDNFNIAAHRPHPPGSPFYILLGRLLVLIAGNVRTSFFLISATASIAATLTLFLLTDRVFGRQAAWIAALVLLTEPPFWYYGAAGNSWTILAALAALNGLCCWRVLKGAPHALPVAAVVLGLSSGFRLDVTLFMGPLWLWCAWRSRAPFLHVVLGLVTIGLSVAAWLIPVVMMTPGGLSMWLLRYTQMFAPEPPTAGDEIRMLLHNTAVLWTYVLVMFGPVAASAALLARSELRTRFRLIATADHVKFFGLWAIPSFVFLWLFDTTEAGHNLLFTVALLPVAAGLLAASPRTAYVKLSAVALVLVLQVAVFFVTRPLTDRVWGPILNSSLTGYSAETLHEREQTITGTLSYIRDTQDPETSVIATVYGESTYRFMMYYLPDYSVIRVLEPNGTIRLARNRTTAALLQPNCVADNIRSIVWVTQALHRSDVVPPNAVLVSSVRDNLWRVHADDPARETEPLPGLPRCTAGDNSTVPDARSNPQ